MHQISHITHIARISALAVAAAAAAGCTAVDVPVAAPPVSLVNAGGQAIGTVIPSQTSGGVTLAISASGLPHGLHGVHVHAVGRCDAPAFESAGPHWNPAAREHGFNNPEGAHAGDLPNITASSGGVARETVVLSGASLAALSDADGSALIIHASADDYITDPSGNSGARIACAVLGAPERGAVVDQGGNAAAQTNAADNAASEDGATGPGARNKATSATPKG